MKTIRTIDLAVTAGRKRQSPRTGFVHLEDTIPIYENFCFAFALFRQRTSESVLEGKELIDRMTAFQTSEGNFPIYLHDFPRCWDSRLALKIAPILIHILRDFHAVLNSEFKEKIEAVLQKAMQCSPLWESRLAACRGEWPGEPDCSTPQEWFEWLISAQLVKKEGSYPIPYHSELQVFLGDHSAHEKGEPQPATIEYLLAEQAGIGKRLLADHPHQISCGLLFPFSSSCESTEPFIWQLPRLLWKGDTVHSLLIVGGKWEENRVIFDLPSGIEKGRDDLIEVALFTDISPETSLWIGEKKGLVFQLGEILSIRTPTLQIDLQFELLEGEGDFLGHLSRGNRPGQVAGRGAKLFDAYDWRIGIRTLRRKGPCKIALEIKKKKFTTEIKS